MLWYRSHRADQIARVVADRHYNRQKPGTPQFVPPGSCFVLRTLDGDAIWVTSWPFARYVKHAWAGCWMNSCFRNEAPGKYLSSELIVQAIAATRFYYGLPPNLGMVTFIDRDKTRKKRDPGRCYRRAGFEPAVITKNGPVEVDKDGHVLTKAGLVALQLLPGKMPDAVPALAIPRVVVA